MTATLVMPDLSELMNEVEHAELTFLQNPPWPTRASTDLWSEDEVRAFVEYAFLALEAAPESLRPKVTAVWSKNMTALRLDGGSVIVRLATMRGYHLLDATIFNGFSAAEMDDAEAAGWDPLKTRDSFWLRWFGARHPGRDEHDEPIYGRPL